jgi:hypothetical protein
MRLDRGIVVATALALSLTLGGCETSDLLDKLSDFDIMSTSKRPLQGERRAVFPEGTPGVPQGVPPELVKGYQQAPEPEPVKQAEPEKPKPKKKVVAVPKKPPPQKSAPKQAADPVNAPWQAPPPQQQTGPAAPWPAPQQQPQVAWPDPPPPPRR